MEFPENMGVNARWQKQRLTICQYLRVRLRCLFFGRLRRLVRCFIAGKSEAWSGSTVARPGADLDLETKLERSTDSQRGGS